VLHYLGTVRMRHPQNYVVGVCNFWSVGAEAVADAVGSHVGRDLALRSGHAVTSWLDESETVTATMSMIHGGTAAMAA
jgi:hypothetical protein